MKCVRATSHVPDRVEAAERLLRFGAGWRPGTLARARRRRPLPGSTPGERRLGLFLAVCLVLVLAVSAAALLPPAMALEETCAAVGRCAPHVSLDFFGELVHIDRATVDEEIAGLGGPALASRRLRSCLRAPKSGLAADRHWVAYAMLGHCGRAAEESVPTLLTAMCSDLAGERERICAAVALGRIGGPRAAGCLATALRERRCAVRCLAQSGLAELDPAELRGVLIPVLQRGDALARSMAVQLLGRGGDPQAMSTLEEALRAETDTGVAEDIRLALAVLRQRTAGR